MSLCVLLFVLSAGCGGQQEEERVLATIGDTEIKVSDFRERLQNLPERYSDMAMEKKGQFLEELINDTLLYQEALRSDIDEDEQIRRMLHEARKKILITGLLKKKVSDRVEITGEDVTGFYEENKDKYMTPEVLKVSHILVPSREEAESIHSSLMRGADFEQTARARSVDPTAQRGGDIGYFPRGQLMPEFEAGFAGLEVGEISGPVKTKLGYHIIKLTDRREPRVMPLDKVRNDVRKRLFALKRREMLEKMLEELREDTSIEINEDVLKDLGTNGKGSQKEQGAEQQGGE
jgi:peptidyl-prolyl cis-trans isomerase C